MFLTLPGYVLSAKQGIDIPYTGVWLGQLSEYRDDCAHTQDGPLLRLSTSVAFMSLTLLSLIESVARLAFILTAGVFTSKSNELIDGFGKGLLTTLFALEAAVSNLFVQSIKDHLVHVDFLIRPGRKPQFLFQAFEVGDYVLAKELIEDGCDPHALVRQEKSPALVPILDGHPHMEELVTLNQYEKDYLKLKDVSHWLGLRGEVTFGKQNINLEGSTSRWPFGRISDALMRYRRTWFDFPMFKLSQTKGEELQKALEDASNERSTYSVAKTIRTGKLCFIDSGWKDHGVCLAFLKGYMAICNRGEGAERPISTLEVFKIDSGKMTSEMVQTLFSFLFIDQAKAFPYLYHELPALLSKKGKPAKDLLCHRFKTIAPHLSRSGNCALSSKTGILRFAWALLCTDNPTECQLKRARHESKMFTDWAAYQSFDALDRDRDFTTMVDPESFWLQAYERREQKLRRYTKNWWQLGKLLTGPILNLLR